MFWNYVVIMVVKLVIHFKINCILYKDTFYGVLTIAELLKSIEGCRERVVPIVFREL